MTTIYCDLFDDIKDSDITYITRCTSRAYKAPTIPIVKDKVCPTNTLYIDNLENDLEYMKSIFESYIGFIELRIIDHYKKKICFITFDLEENATICIKDIILKKILKYPITYSRTSTKCRSTFSSENCYVKNVRNVQDQRTKSENCDIKDVQSSRSENCYINNIKNVDIQYPRTIYRSENYYIKDIKDIKNIQEPKNKNKYLKNCNPNYNNSFNKKYNYQGPSSIDFRF